MRKYLWIIILFIIVQAKGQQDPQYSHYMMLKAAYNPAYAGINQNISINLLSRTQWMKFKGAPKTNVLTIDAPLNIFGSQAGIGLKIINDQYAFVNDVVLGPFFSKSFSLPVGNLSLGIGTNIFSKDFNAKWVFPDQEEALLSGKSKSIVLDFDAGMFYTLNNFYAGFSITHVTAPKFVFLGESGQSTQVGLTRHYYFTTGYNITPAGSLFNVIPSALIKSDGSIIQYDINVSILYNKKIWSGVSYRNKESIILFFGTSYIKDIKLGLSYDFLLNSIGRVSSGSFEVYIGYNFSILKMARPQHYHNVKTL